MWERSGGTLAGATKSPLQGIQMQGAQFPQHTVVTTGVKCCLPGKLVWSAPHRGFLGGLAPCIGSLCLPCVQIPGSHMESKDSVAIMCPHRSDTGSPSHHLGNSAGNCLSLESPAEPARAQANKQGFPRAAVSGLNKE